MNANDNGEALALKRMKDDACAAMRNAERLMYRYACACEVDAERTRAFDVYENIRTAGTVI